MRTGLRSGSRPVEGVLVVQTSAGTPSEQCRGTLEQGGPCHELATPREYPAFAHICTLPVTQKGIKGSRKQNKMKRNGVTPLGVTKIVDKLTVSSSDLQ